jgi:hypothetical protein
MLLLIMIIYVSAASYWVLDILLLSTALRGLASIEYNSKVTGFAFDALLGLNVSCIYGFSIFKY